MHARFPFRRQVLVDGARALLAALPLLAIAPTQAQAQPAWPDKPVRIVVPYGAGQGADVLARTVAQEVSRTLKQPFVIENRAGAGGNIGTAVVAKSAPDGYTFVLGTNATHAANEFLYPNLGFDPGADFEPVALLGMLPMVISTTLPDLPVNGLAQLIAMAKAKPDTLAVGLPSTTAQVVFSQFVASTKAPLTGVKYKASSQSMTDVIGGQIPLVIDTLTATRPQVAGGKLRALAITAASSTDMLPGIRTVAEQGVPGFEVVAWNAFFAPRGTPAEVVRVFAEHVERALKEPETQARLRGIGVEPRFLGPAALGRYVAAERPKWGAVIKSAGIRVD